MNIALAFNLHGPDGKQDDPEFDDPAVIDSIESVLRRAGHQVMRIEADNQAFQTLQEHQPGIDIVFNIAEGLGGDARESQIPLFCEMLGLPYTHSTPTTHAVGLNKQLTKRLVSAEGIATPHAVLVRTASDANHCDEVALPVIIKFNAEGTSKGLTEQSYIQERSDLANALVHGSEHYTRDVLVEHYIEGREFTVAVVGNASPKVYPILEQKFDLLPQGAPSIATLHFKKTWALANSIDCPARLSEEQTQSITEASIRIFRALDCRDCCRIDYRMDKDGTLYFLEINALPGLNPDPVMLSYFPIISRAFGQTYDELILTLLNEALSRYPHLATAQSAAWH